MRLDFGMRLLLTGKFQGLCSTDTFVLNTAQGGEEIYRDCVTSVSSNIVEPIVCESPKSAKTFVVATAVLRIPDEPPDTLAFVPFHRKSSNLRAYCGSIVDPASHWL